MAQEKAVTKKDIQQLLDGQTKSILGVVDKKIDGQTKAILSVVDKKIDSQTKAILSAVDKKLETNQESMAVMVNTAVQATQDILITEMKNGFKQVTDQINKINLNAADVVRKEEFDKLESRVTDVEEVVNLRLKKA